MSQVKAWSASAYNLYEQCPLKYKLEKIDKLKTPTPDAFIRGRKVHKEAESFLKGEVADLPGSLEQFEGLMVQLRDMSDTIIEEQWGFTAKWKPTGWFAKDTWFRAVLDAGVVYEDCTMDIIDHKTGKKYGSNNDQMELFSIAGFSRFPDITHVTTRLWYLDSGDEDIAEFTRKDHDKLKKKWEKRVEPMFLDEVFAPRPNDKCKWCHFSKSNTGKCKFG